MEAIARLIVQLVLGVVGAFILWVFNFKRYSFKEVYLSRDNPNALIGLGILVIISIIILFLQL